MNRLPLKILLFALLLCLASCECYPTIKGIILDEKTQMPIENAHAEFGNSKYVTDTKGQFEISDSGCDLKLIVTKNDYKPFGLKLSKKDDKLTFHIDKKIIYKDLDNLEEQKFERNTYLSVRTTMINSTHFEYLGESDGLIIYLEKRQ